MIISRSGRRHPDKTTRADNMARNMAGEKVKRIKVTRYNDFWKDVKVANNRLLCPVDGLSVR